MTTTSTEIRTRNNIEFAVDFRRYEGGEGILSWPSTEARVRWTINGREDYITVYARLDEKRNPKTRDIRVFAKVDVSISSSYTPVAAMAAMSSAVQVATEVAEELYAAFDVEAAQHTQRLHEEREQREVEREARNVRVAASKPSPDEVGRKPKTYAEMVGRRLWHPDCGRGAVTVANPNTCIITVEWDEDYYRNSPVNHQDMGPKARQNAIWLK